MTSPRRARPVLEVVDLMTRFHTEQGVVHAVNGVSFSLTEGESMAIVGESGSGKSVTALSIMGLLVRTAGAECRGRALLDGRDLLALRPRELARVRGKEIAMIFQDPVTSLNPVLTVGRQLGEAVLHHAGASRAEARGRSVELLDLVGIPNARGRLSEYPHQFSGGQRQRIMIAMALALGPRVLIADEPTTALDVTIQAQVVELIGSLRQRLGMAVLWITHDLGLVAGLVDTVLVMYAGRIVERAAVRDLFERPLHPYTKGLLQAVPAWNDTRGGRLRTIDGRPPDLRSAPKHCAFAPRCPHALDRCWAERPPLQEADGGRASACWRWRELEGAALAREPRP